MVGTSGAAERRPLLRHPWRVAITVGVLLATLNLAVLLLSESDTTRSGTTTYPNAIDVVSPTPGDLIRPLDTVTADLRNDLTGVLVIDGAEVPEDQLDRVVPLGQLSFRPGAERDLVKFLPGTHTATVLFWDQTKDRPITPGSYSWSFRVGA